MILTTDVDANDVHLIVSEALSFTPFLAQIDTEFVWFSRCDFYRTDGVGLAPYRGGDHPYIIRLVAERGVQGSLPAPHLAGAPIAPIVANVHRASTQPDTVWRMGVYGTNALLLAPDGVLYLRQAPGGPTGDAAPVWPGRGASVTDGAAEWLGIGSLGGAPVSGVGPSFDGLTVALVPVDEP